MLYLLWKALLAYARGGLLEEVGVERERGEDIMNLVLAAADGGGWGFSCRHEHCHASIVIPSLNTRSRHRASWDGNEMS